MRSKIALGVTRPVCISGADCPEWLPPAKSSATAAIRWRLQVQPPLLASHTRKAHGSSSFGSGFNGIQGPNRPWKASFAQGDAQAPAPCAKAAAPFRPRLREPLPNAPPRAPRPALLPCARPKSSQPGTVCLAPARDRRRHMWGSFEFSGPQDVCSAHVWRMMSGTLESRALRKSSPASISS